MEADEYRKLAEVEDAMWYFHALHGHIERELSKALGEGEATILDAGCGTGGLIRRLGPKHPRWRWTGVDLEPLAVGFARQRVGAVEIREGSVTALPWPNQTFDAIVSADVLYHVDDDRGAMREFFRVLKPGGVVVMNVPAYQWLWSYHDEAVHSKRRYERAEVTEKLRAAGFADVRTTHWNALLFPLIWAKRKLFSSAKDTSDVKASSAPAEAVFRGIMGVERAWLRTGQSWAWGSSVFAVARKP